MHQKRNSIFLHSLSLSISLSLSLSLCPTILKRILWLFPAEEGELLTSSIHPPLLSYWYSLDSMSLLHRLSSWIKGEPNHRKLLKEWLSCRAASGDKLSWPPPLHSPTGWWSSSSSSPIITPVTSLAIRSVKGWKKSNAHSGISWSDHLKFYEYRLVFSLWHLQSEGYMLIMWFTVGFIPFRSFPDQVLTFGRGSPFGMIIRRFGKEGEDPQIVISEIQRKWQQINSLFSLFQVWRISTICCKGGGGGSGDEEEEKPLLNLHRNSSKSNETSDANDDGDEAGGVRQDEKESSSKINAITTLNPSGSSSGGVHHVDREEVR